MVLGAILAGVPTASATGLVSAQLPTERFILADAGTLDGAAMFQTLGAWLALFAMIFWIGGVIWEAWILPPSATPDGELATAIEAAARRFRTLAPYALGLALVADIDAIRFGSFWWLRQLVVAAALLLTIQAARRGAVSGPGSATPAGGEVTARSTTLDWRGELAATLRGVGELPDRVVLGWRRLRPIGRLDVALGGALIVAFALSDQMAGVPATQTSYAFLVDLLQLLAEAAWLGGLFYLAVVLLPVSLHLAPRQRARLLSLGLPEFGAFALVAGVLFVIAGALNAKLHLSSVQQVLATTYGRTFIVELELFLIMVAVSAYLVLYLRPRLALELGNGSRLVAPGAVAAREPMEMNVSTKRRTAAAARRTRQPMGNPPASAGSRLRGRASRTRRMSRR